jgi:hypothetical protein
MPLDPDIAAHFTLVCEEVFELPWDWTGLYEDTINAYEYACILIAGIGLSDEQVATANDAMLMLYDKSRPGRGIVRGRFDAVDKVLDKYEHVPMQVRSTFVKSIQSHAFALGMMYPIDNFATFSETDIKRALFIAARKPGEVSWETVTDLLSADVDEELISSFLESLDIAS